MNKKPILSVKQEREIFIREDGSTYTRDDIFIKLAVTFRDEMLARLKGPALSVYLCIALHCGESMQAWPALRTIERETGYSRPCVVNAIGKLEQMKLIERRRRKNGDGDNDSNLYTIRGWVKMGGVVNLVNQGGKLSLPGVVNLVNQKKKPAEEEPKKKQQNAVVVAQNLSALKYHGITENSRSRAVAGLAHVTPDLINETARRLRRDPTTKNLAGRLLATLEHAEAVTGWTDAEMQDARQLAGDVDQDELDALIASLEN